jgi:hypothetical protein
LRGVQPDLEAELASGSYDRPIKDNLFCCLSTESVDNNSIYSDEELRIYDYLDCLRINPIDVAVFLGDAMRASYLPATNRSVESQLCIRNAQD